LVDSSKKKNAIQSRLILRPPLLDSQVSIAV
jgi:hypothetical protein